MRFTAPHHTTCAHLSIGSFDVGEDGTIEVPDDTPIGDLSGLAANGYVRAPDATGEEAAAPIRPVRTQAPPAPSGSDTEAD